MRPRLKLVLAYDGTELAGSQRQSGNRTVQGVLEEAIARLSNGPVKVAMAGRTDAGVHALGQVAACEDIRCDLEPEEAPAGAECSVAGRCFGSGGHAGSADVRSATRCQVATVPVSNLGWAKAAAPDLTEPASRWATQRDAYAARSGPI